MTAVWNWQQVPDIGQNRTSAFNKAVYNKKSDDQRSLLNSFSSMNCFAFLNLLTLLNRPYSVHTHPDSSLDAATKPRKIAQNFSNG